MFNRIEKLPAIASAPRHARRPANSHVPRIATRGAVALITASLVFAAATWIAHVSEASPLVTPATPGLVVASLGSRPSHNGRYRAEVVSVSSLAVGVTQRWVVQLRSTNHLRVAGARIAVHVRMLDAQERTSPPAVASYLGGGRYQVEGIRFGRPGWWNVALVVDGEAGVDSVAFNVVLR